MDELGNLLKPIGSNLTKIKSILKNEDSISLDGISFFAVNDVDNPLFGETGASYTYAGQKGASRLEIEELNKDLISVSEIIKKQLEKNVAEIPGAGAAGGTAYGLKVFCGAEFISGVDFVLEVAKVKELLSEQKFDYILTGEGKFDHQTLHGKLINGVLNLGKSHDIPVLVFCGELDVDEKDLKNLGLAGVLEIKNATKSLAFNMQNASELLKKSVATFFQK